MQHIAMVRSMSRFTLKGLCHSDRKHLIQRMDNDDPTEVEVEVSRSVHELMMGKKIHGTKVWVLIAQIPNGRWVCFFCYGIGNDVHRSYLLEWSGGVSSHVRYHLLRQGIEPNGINNLIWGSFDFQATKEAAEAVMGNDGHIRTKSQAAAEQVLQNHDNTWVDLTLGMTQCQKEEYKCQQAAQAKTAGLDWKYNFDEEHSVDPVAGRADDGTAFTLTRNISLGDTAYDMVAVDDDRSDLDDILNDPYDNEEEPSK
jgi:hypothetical protein